MSETVLPEQSKGIRTVTRSPAFALGTFTCAPLESVALIESVPLSTLAQAACASEKKLRENLQDLNTGEGMPLLFR